MDRSQTRIRGVILLLLSLQVQIFFLLGLLPSLRHEILGYERLTLSKNAQNEACISYPESVIHGSSIRVTRLDVETLKLLNSVDPPI
jgi:hypothetical protein